MLSFTWRERRRDEDSGRCGRIFFRWYIHPLLWATENLLVDT